MSKEKAKEFLIAFRQTQPDEAVINRFQEAQSDDERFMLYAETAAAAGYDVTASEIREALGEMDAERKAKTQEAVQDLQELEDDEVENTAGGVTHYTACSYNTSTRKEGCIGDFTDDDCLWDNACDHLYRLYYDCEEKYHKD